MQVEANLKLLKQNILKPELLPFTLTLGAWLTLSASGIIPEKVIPKPLSVLEAFLLNLPSILTLSARTLANLASSVALSFSAALPLAFATGLNGKADRSLTAFLTFLGSLPNTAFLPLTLLWLGRGSTAVVVTASFCSFFIAYFTLRDGVKSIPREYLEYASTLRLSTVDILVDVMLPGVTPSLVTALRLSIQSLWDTLIGMEMIAGVSGLGHYISVTADSGRLPECFASLLLVGLISLALDSLLLDKIEEKVRGWL